MKKRRTKNTVNNHSARLRKQLPQVTAAGSKAASAVEGPLEQLPVDKTKAEHWARLLNQSLRRSVEALFEAGMHLIAAKVALKHGEWLKLFEQKLIPVDERGAQRLMQMARSSVLSKPANWSLLPPSPQALCALSQADSDAVEHALTKGQINPLTTIADAKSFLHEHPAPGAKTRRAGRPKDFDPDRSLTRCQDVLWSELHKCPGVHVEVFIDGLEDILKQMKEAAHDVQSDQGSIAGEQTLPAGSAAP
jgi:hypothetical protein